MKNKNRNNLLKRLDWLSIIIYLVLVIFGYINIYSSAWSETNNSIFNPGSMQMKQLVWFGASAIMIFIIFLIDIKVFSVFSIFLYSISVLSLIAVLVFGKEVHGAKSWLDFGFIRFQPSEFAKIFTALILARLLTSHGFSIKKPRHLLIAFSLIALPMIFIMLQPDTGTALVYFAFIIVLYREGINQIVLFTAIIAIILFIASLILPIHWIIAGTLITLVLFLWLNEKNIKSVMYAIGLPVLIALLIYSARLLFNIEIELKYIFGISAALSALVFIPFILIQKNKNALVLSIILFVSVFYINSIDIVYSKFLKQHQRDRIELTLGIKEDPQGIGYNVNQSKIAIGSGEFSGKGFLNGTQTKFDFVPEQSTDFIFCTVGEEFGFIGSTTVVVLFIILIIRIMIISERQRSSFARVYGYCVASIIFFHFMINIGMTIGLLPVIGIPLPFFSYGGSSLMAFTLLLFILLRLDASRLELFH